MTAPPHSRPPRQIHDLKWAARCQRPLSISQHQRLKGSRAAGMRYERGLARELPGAEHGAWFEYEDAGGLGFCQPDLLLLQNPRLVVILEAKNTWTPNAHRQLDGLYIPVVSEALQLPCVGIVVARRLTPAMGVKLFQNLPEAIDYARPGRHTVLHWLGNSSLVLKEVA